MYSPFIYVMIEDFILYILVVLFLTFVINIIINKNLDRQLDDSIEKVVGFECGFQSFKQDLPEIETQYYAVALMYLIFDIEVSFLIPWTIGNKAITLYGQCLIFLLLLLLTFSIIYEYALGIFIIKENMFVENTYKNLREKGIIYKQNEKENKAWYSNYSNFFLITSPVVSNLELFENTKLEFKFLDINQWFFIENKFWIFLLISFIIFLNEMCKKVKNNDILIDLFCFFIIFELIDNFLSIFMKFQNEIYIFSNMLSNDILSNFFEFIMNILILMVLWNADDIEDPLSDLIFVKVYIIYYVFVILLIHSVNILTIFILLEGIAFCLFILMIFKTNEWGPIEAATKYFIQSTLIGIVFCNTQAGIYFYTDNFLIYEIFYSLMNNTVDYYAKYLILTIFYVLFFKLSIAPLHFWTAEIYEGNNYFIILNFAIFNKIGAFAVLIKLIEAIFYVFDYSYNPNNKFIKVEFISNIIEIIEISAIITIILGSIFLIRQVSIKGYLAYSTITNMGFMLLSLIFNLDNIDYYEEFIEQVTLTITYFVTYICLSTKWIEIMSQTYVYNSRIKRFMPINYLTDLSGIIKQNSFIGFLLIIILFGLSGIPPSSVFFVKLGILENIDNSLLLMILVFLNGLSIIYYVVLMKIIIIEKSVKRIYTYVNYNIDMMSLIVVVFGFVFLIGIFLPYI